MMRVNDGRMEIQVAVANGHSEVVEWVEIAIAPDDEDEAVGPANDV